VVTLFRRVRTTITKSRMDRLLKCKTKQRIYYSLLMDLERSERQRSWIDQALLRNAK